MLGANQGRQGCPVGIFERSPQVGEQRSHFGVRAEGSRGNILGQVKGIHPAGDAGFLHLPPFGGPTITGEPILPMPVALYASEPVNGLVTPAPERTFRVPSSCVMSTTAYEPVAAGRVAVTVAVGPAASVAVGPAGDVAVTVGVTVLPPAPLTTISTQIGLSAFQPMPNNAPEAFLNCQ